MTDTKSIIDKSVQLQFDENIKMNRMNNCPRSLKSNKAVAVCERRVGELNHQSRKLRLAVKLREKLENKRK